MKKLKIPIVPIIIALLLPASLKAQMDERNINSATENYVQPSGSFHILKIRKSYVLGDGVTVRSANGFLNMTQSLQTLYSFDTKEKNLSDINSTFSISRARLSVSANIFDKRCYVYGRINFPANFQSTTSGTRSFNTVLQEAYFEFRPSIVHSFNFGLRADYIDSRETRIEGESLGFINRSAVSGSFDAIFDYGIRYRGIYKLGGRHLLRPYISITTGDSRSASQKNFGGFRYGIRIDYLPFDKFSRGGEYYMDDLAREEKPKLVVGIVYNYNNGASSATGTNGGRYIYGDINQKIILPNYSKFGVDYLFKYRGFYSLGSFVSTRASVPIGITGEFRLNGRFIPYNTSQTNEQTKNTVLSRLNLGTGINLQSGYVLPNNWALGARYSKLKASQVSDNFADYDRYYTLVVSKYLSGHNLKVQAEIGFDELKNELQTATLTRNYYAQMLLTLQL
ncbi:MAG: hypothetical protein ACOYOA_10610 [Saprospiraceae bacterium]